MGQLISKTKKGDFLNQDGVGNLIHYITRTRKDEKKNDLIGYGAVGLNMYDPNMMIMQIEQILQLREDMQAHKKMHHAFYNLTQAEVLALGWNGSTIMALAQDTAEHYYRMGYPVVYAIHQNEKSEDGACVHIHFAVCGVSFETGNLFQESRGELQATNRLFNMQQKEYEAKCAVRFTRPPMVGLGR